MFRQKRSIFKRFTWILSGLLVITALAGGCSKTSGSQDVSTKPTATENNTVTTKGSKEPSPSTKGNDLKDTGISPVGIGFTKFMEVKSKAYEMLEPAMNNITASGDPMASLAILPLMTTDLSILPLSMLGALPSKGNNVWEGKLIMLFDGTGRVDLKGDICTFTMEVAAKNESKETMTITGEYDTKKDSLKAIFTTQGKENIWFEYVASGNGYVSQFYTEENGKISLIKNSFDEKNLYAGMFAEGGKPDSIYQKQVEGGESFVKTDKLMVVIENGKGYAIIDGKKSEY